MNIIRQIVGGIIVLIGLLGALFGVYMMSINGLGIIFGLPLLLICLIVIGVGVLVIR